MKNKNINLTHFLLAFNKKKFLVIIMSLIFFICGYAYQFFKIKNYTTYISIIEVPEAYFNIFVNDFNTFTSNSSKNRPKEFAELFNNKFKLNLLSLDNLVEFAEKNNEIDDFKFYLKSNNIKIRDFFSSKLRQIENKKLSSVLGNKEAKNKDKDLSKIKFYSFDFQKPLPGEIFLQDYVIYIKKKQKHFF